jgi:serine protease
VSGRGNFADAGVFPERTMRGGLTSGRLSARVRAGAVIAASAFVATAAAPRIDAAAPAAAGAAQAAGNPASEETRPFVRGEVLVRFRGREADRVIELPEGAGVRDAAAALESNPSVAYAAPNHIAHASVTAPFVPNDAGTSGDKRGWQEMQWNFLPCGTLCGEPPAAPNLESVGGVDAPGAWANLIEADRPGGKGVTVAVVDTGVAYRSIGHAFKRSPDFTSRQFVPGHDFVEGDGTPLDENGHGTHVAGTIGEQTHNRRALTGLAYGAEIMPVRVLNAKGEGTARNVARGIEWAAEQGANVINLSLEFCVAACKPSAQVTRCDDVPSICEAIDEARAAGALVVGSAGNEGVTQVSYPGHAGLAAAGSTERACLAEYTNFGEGLDLVAPGGGADSPAGGAHCAPFTGGRTIFQLTLTGKGNKPGSFRKFGYPRYEGSSMASAHVAGAAALVWATLERQLGHDPTPSEVQSRLEATARTEGALADQTHYGAGLLDAAAATSP